MARGSDDETRPHEAGGRTPGPAGPAGPFLDGLLGAQREAVEADDPVLCLLAGAGAGKTRVLTLRVARRAADRTAHPDHVLVCTFSRKAADELRTRLWSLGVGADVHAGTFHRTALGLIRQHRADRDRNPPTVLADRRAVLADLLGGAETARPRRGRAAPAPATDRRVVARLEADISWAKARMVGPEDLEAAARARRRRLSLGSGRVAELFARYEEEKRRRGAVDLDDLPLVAADLLETDPRFAAGVRWRYRHLFVDEMQDVNPAQFRLLRALAGDDPDLFVVGDPNQSVYGWNGADPELLDRFPTLYPQARVLRLDRNHRCAPPVVAVAAAALGLAGDAAPRSTRHGGSAPRVVAHPTDADEAAWVARQVWLAHRPGRRWRHLAVLARTNAQLHTIAAAFDAARVPHRLAGRDQAPASDLPPVRPGDVDDDTADVADVDGEEADAVTLATFHRAKGLQWPAVFVVGLADGLVPMATARTTAARDEERRLLYVALTRAEDELTCSWAERPAGAAGAAGPPRAPSPWLAAIEQAVADLTAADAPADPARVAEHLAALRRLLTTPASDG